MTDTIPIFNDKTKLTLTDADKASVSHMLKQATTSLADFANTLDTAPCVTMTDVHAHIDLMEHHLIDLITATHYDSGLTQDAKNRCAEIQEKNQRIRELTDMLDKRITPDAISKALRQYDDVVQITFEALGFQLSSTKIINSGFMIEIPSKIEVYDQIQKTYYETDDDTCKHVFDTCRSMYGCIINSPDIVLYKDDDRRSHLADTNVNNRILATLLTKVFPDIELLYGFSYLDNINRALPEITVYIPFTDVERIYTQANPT